MATHQTDIIIFGAGIAGLWTLKTLTERGYSVLLLETNAIGAGQTIASQGIIHSGLKYKLGRKSASISKNIAAMPERWRAELKNECLSAPGQNLFIPKGFMGSIIKTVASQTLQSNARVLPMSSWPSVMRASGFNGSIIATEEPVLDIPAVLFHLAWPRMNAIRRYSRLRCATDYNRQIDHVEIDGHIIKAQAYVFAAAEINHEVAQSLGHAQGLKTQKRPLLMGLMNNAPFPLYAHFVGTSDKPVATITTHKTKDGNLVWYIGGAAAERAKDSSEYDTFDAIRKAFAKYMPAINMSNIQWATLPIDRVEGQSGSGIPDIPVIHQAENALYVWPTKLTFAPLAADSVAEKLGNLHPSGITSNWSFLSQPSFAETPWDKAAWKKLS